MSIRSLLAMLVAVALLFAPALTLAGEAAAAAPDHHSQMMESDHCSSAAASHSGDEEEPRSDGAGAKNCCVAMCLGVAIAPSGTADTIAVHSLAPSFALANQYSGRIAEIATPPPKFAGAPNS